MAASSARFRNHAGAAEGTARFSGRLHSDAGSSVSVLDRNASLITPAARPPAEPPDTRNTLEMLATAILFTLSVAILYLAREILVPVAIAVLLSFVLSPLVKVFRKIGVGKRVAVGIVVFTTFLIAVAVGIVLARQVTQLATDAPQYQLAVTDLVI